MSLLLLLGGCGLILAAIIRVSRRVRAERAADLVLVRRLNALLPSAAAVPVAEQAWLEWVKAQVPAFIRRSMSQADVDLTPRMLTAGGAILLLAAVLAWWRAGAFGLVLALAIGTLLPLLYLGQLAKRRMAAFVEVLPHYLDSIRQLLLVGNSLQQALAKSTENTQPAVQRYLRPAIRRMGNGAPVVNALETVADRIDLPEFHMVVAAVRTNARFGGSVAPTLAGLIRLLRDRARVGRELSAASAETRMSALVLCALPPVALSIISLINYGYMKYLWEEPAGRRLLMIGLAFQVVGMLTMRRLMRLTF